MMRLLKGWKAFSSLTGSPYDPTHLQSPDCHALAIALPYVLLGYPQSPLHSPSHEDHAGNEEGGHDVHSKCITCQITQ